jgi:ABC-type glycerol-3-phosphate transport system permease component
MTTTASRGTTTPPASAEPTAPRRRGGRTWFPYLILLPAVILELLIHIVPMVTGFWMSFVELTKFFIRRWTEAPFAGLENYRIAVDLDTPIGQELLSSFLVTLAFTALVVGLSWGLGMAAAVALQRPFRGRGVFRTLFLVPYALPLYAAVITWNFMLQRDTGVINHLLVDQLGILDGAPFWLIGDNAFVSVVVVAIWRMWPFAFLMFMAGLQSIPDARAGEPDDAAGDVPVGVQRLQHPVHPLRHRAAARRRPHQLPHLQRLVPVLGLRRGQRDERAPAAVPAGRLARLSVRHPVEEGALPCVRPSGRRSSAPSCSWG